MGTDESMVSHDESEEVTTSELQEIKQSLQAMQKTLDALLKEKQEAEKKLDVLLSGERVFFSILSCFDVEWKNEKHSRLERIFQGVDTCSSLLELMKKQVAYTALNNMYPPFHTLLWQYLLSEGDYPRLVDEIEEEIQEKTKDIWEDLIAWQMVNVPLTNKQILILRLIPQDEKAHITHMLVEQGRVYKDEMGYHLSPEEAKKLEAHYCAVIIDHYSEPPSGDYDEDFHEYEIWFCKYEEEDDPELYPPWRNEFDTIPSDIREKLTKQLREEGKFD